MLQRGVGLARLVQLRLLLPLDNLEEVVAHHLELGDLVVDNLLDQLGGDRHRLLHLVLQPHGHLFHLDPGRLLHLGPELVLLGSFLLDFGGPGTLHKLLGNFEFLLLLLLGRLLLTGFPLLVVVH